MNKKLSKVLALGLSVLTVASTTVPAFAATNYKDSIASVVEDINGGDVVGKDENQSAVSKYAEYSDDTAASTDVYVSQKSTFSVVAPVVAVLNGKAGEVNSGDVRYKVFGNIAADERIVVEPDASFELHQDGKKDITCTVEGKDGTAQTEFTYADGVRPDEADALTQDYTITAQNLTAGSWSGSFNTNISLEQSPLPGYMTLYEYDLSATENDNVKAYYMVPNENTSPIEIETTDNDSSVTANANLLSSVTNMLKPMTAYAADENVIEYNGIRYDLSDEDTLVITGAGEMKENIQADLVDYKGIMDAVSKQFPNMSIVTELHFEESHYKIPSVSEEKFCITWSSNHLYPTRVDNVISKEYCKDELSAVKEYIDSIKGEYVKSTPKNVLIKDGVMNISYRAFDGCTSLTSVTIPDSVTSIGGSAFNGCTGLASIAIPNSVTSIGGSAFNGCTGLTSVTIPDNVTAINLWTFNDCYNLKSVTIPNNVASIGTGAFQGCRNLTNITLPDSITSIGDSAFKNCGLTSVTIPEDVTNIKDYTFYNCRNLVSVTIPNKLTSISNSAFENCASLTNVTIPNTVTSIGDSAFQGCTGLTSVKISENISKIGSNAFWHCRGLKNIDVDSNNPNYSSQDGVLFDKDKTVLIQYPAANERTVYAIPNSIRTIGFGAFDNSTNLTDVVIPYGVTTIGEYAFTSTGLTSITIPNSVTNIGAYAFEVCENLEKVLIPDSVTSIGSEAFGKTNIGFLPSSSTIYCETQAVADLLNDSNFCSSKTTVVVDATKF